MLKYRFFVIFKTSETVNDVALIRHVVDKIEAECLVYARSCIIERKSDVHWRFDVKSENSIIVHRLVDLLLGEDGIGTYYMSRIKD